MAEDPEGKYLVRDPEGNIYGPADPEMLREWVRQGRIVRGMAMAPRQTREWIEVSQHPALADMFLLEKEVEEGLTTQSPGQDRQAGPRGDSFTVAAAESAASAQEVPVTRVQRAEPMTPVSPAVRVMVDYESPRTNELRQNIPGTIGLVAGVLGVATGLPACICVCLWPVSGLLSLTAIVLSSIGLWQVRADPQRYATRSAPLTGLVLGVVGLLFSVLWPVAAIFFRVIRHP